MTEEAAAPSPGALEDRGTGWAQTNAETAKRTRNPWDERRVPVTEAGYAETSSELAERVQVRLNEGGFAEAELRLRESTAGKADSGCYRLGRPILRSAAVATVPCR